ISIFPARTIRPAPSAISPSSQTRILAMPIPSLVARIAENRIGPYDLRQVVCDLTIPCTSAPKGTKGPSGTQEKDPEKTVSAPTTRSAPRRLMSLPASDAPEVGLGMLLRAADNSFNRVLRLKLAKHGVSFSEFQHLRQLWDEEGLNQVEMSRRIGIERASSTAVIDSLLRKKLIRRSPDPSDKRKLLVYLTARGAALRDR